MLTRTVNVAGKPSTTVRSAGWEVMVGGWVGAPVNGVNRIAGMGSSICPLGNCQRTARLSPPVPSFIKAST